VTPLKDVRLPDPDPAPRHVNPSIVKYCTSMAHTIPRSVRNTATGAKTETYQVSHCAALTNASISITASDCQAVWFTRGRDLGSNHVV